MLFSINLWWSDNSVANTLTILNSIVGTLSFGFSSWMIYIINDFVDKENDKTHPVKSGRPIASGLISINIAILLIIIFLSLSLIAAYSLEIDFFLSVISYQILMICYCFFLKKIFIVDVISVATGYMLRAFGGALVVQYSHSHFIRLGLITENVINISIWLTLCTGLGSLFVLLMKRYSELSSRNKGHLKRNVIYKYDLNILSKSIIASELMTYFCYLGYCISSSFTSELLKGNTPPDYSLILTLPWVIIGMRRYKYVSTAFHIGEHPEQVITKDKLLQLIFILWVISCTFLISTRV